MSTCEEQIVSLKKYLKKLLYIIKNEASITFMDKKIISKKRIDDILCCVEASFPELYKECAARVSSNLESYVFYQKLLRAINNKFILSSSSYLVYYLDAQQNITSFLSTIDSDIQRIFNNN